MALFNFRAHAGLTRGHAHTVRDNVYNLVRQAAAGVGWNLLCMPTAGFTMTEVKGKMKSIHTKTGIEFKSSFLMQQVTGSQQWEGHAKVDELRLDLQSIDNGWANWAIQTNGTNSKTVATCLMQVGKSFSQNQLAHALNQSAQRTKICELTQ